MEEKQMRRLSKFGLYLAILFILNTIGSKVYYGFIANTLDSLLYGEVPDPMIITHGGNYTYLLKSKIKKYISRIQRYSISNRKNIF